MKIILPAIFLFSLILLTGCNELQNPKDLYKALNEKGNNLPDGKFHYSVSFGSGSSGMLNDLSSLYGGMSYEMDLYRLNGKQKKLVEISVLGYSVTYAIFELNENSITCVEGSSSLGYGNYDDIECNYGDSANEIGLSIDQLTFDLNEYIDQLEVTLVGEKNYAGRGCYDFLIHIDKNILEEIEYDSLNYYFLGGDRAEYEICLDKQHGFVSYINLKTYEFSELAQKETEAMNIEISLRSFDPFGVREEDFKLPIDFEIGRLKCNADKVDFDVYFFNQMSGNFDVKMSKSTYGSDDTNHYLEETLEIGEIIEGEKKVYVINLNSELETGTHAIEICSLESCQKKSCYYYQPYEAPTIVTIKDSYSNDDFEISKIICDKNSVKFDINALIPISGVLDANLVLSGFNQYSYSSNNGYNIGNLQAGESKQVTLELERSLNYGGKYDFDICLNSNNCLAGKCNYTMIFPKPEPKPERSCEDSDGGKNFEVKGVITYVDSNGRSGFLSDYCRDDGAIQGLQEYACTEHGFGSFYEDCECEDGACK